MTKLITPEDLIIDNYYIEISRGLCQFIGSRDYENKKYSAFMFANNEKLFLNKEKLAGIRNYDNTGNGIKRLNKLGDNTSWNKTKAKEIKKASEQSDELLKLYVERKSIHGNIYAKDTERQSQFEADFPFTVTDSQAETIQNVKDKLEIGEVLNYICVGDTSYGKSEVYSQVMFKVVDNKKQVALLLPSSILANQAYVDTIERFKNFPDIHIVLFSRDNTAKQKREILERTKSGFANVVIGTTSICSKCVEYNDLGLLIVDECHKMGINDKTKLQNYKKNLNTLYLSATPLPAETKKILSGVYDMSKLTTPPPNKKATITEVAEDNDDIIKKYIERELETQGQVFVIRNNVSQILFTKFRLENLVKGIKVGIVHGQMPADQAKVVMADFKAKKYNVLLASSIAECGINVPNAKTIIVLESENFGLSSLHQLRGRSNRSSNQSFCLLLYSKDKQLKQKAIDRLKIMEENSFLGAGFIISQKDSDMRGEGEIFGKHQSGHISAVGMEYFNELLEQSIKDKKMIIDNEKSLNEAV